jgi:hypothetical protein
MFQNLKVKKFLGIKFSKFQGFGASWFLNSRVPRFQGSDEEVSRIQDF